MKTVLSKICMPAAYIKFASPGGEECNLSACFSDPNSAAQLRTSVFLSHLFLSRGKISPSVTHVCSDCRVMGNDTGLLGVASVRAPLSQALNCSLGGRRYGSLPQPSNEAVDDKTTRPILQPGCVSPATIEDLVFYQLKSCANASRVP